MTSRLLAASTFCSLILFSSSALHADEVTIASWGGSYQEAQSKALFKPVSEALGIKIREETYKGIGQVRTKVAAGAVPWDIIDTGSGGGARGCAEALLQPLDYTRAYADRIATFARAIGYDDSVRHP